MRRILAILLIAILSTGLLLPVAQANWKWRGTNEPDTARDVSDGLMYLDPDTNPDQSSHKVYFNVYGQVSRFTYYNPNVAATGSRMQPPAQTTFTGLLGIWKDCNKDGYIGMSEYGLFEYRSELLAATGSVCPAQPVAVPGPVPNPYPHNDGTWVREFIFIGKKENGDANDYAQNPTVMKVQGTNMWGDWRLPGDTPAIVCPLGGNIGTRSTGAMLDYADCLLGYRTMDTLNSVQDDTGLPVGGWDKSNPEESDAFLNMPNPGYTTLYGPNQDGREGVMGRDDTRSGYEAPQAYEAWDCDNNAVGNRPGPSGSTSVNPSGSVYETANDTYNVVRVEECKKSGDEGLFYTRIDGTNEATQPFRGKVSVDHAFLFSWGNRKLPAASAPVLGNYFPADGGLAVERNDGPIGPAWRTNPGITTGPQVVNRASLSFANANYMTFYARLGDLTGLAVPSAASKFYGAENCVNGIEGIDGVATTTNVQNGWNCDPDSWTADCAAQTPPTLAAQCHQPGEVYQLRDIDCWDGQIVRTVPVYASTVQLSEGGVCAVNDAYEQPLS